MARAVKQPTISKRARKTPASPIRKLHAYAERAKERGVSVFHLNIGQPDLPTPAAFFRELRRFKQNIVAYAPSRGYRAVVQAWQRYYQSHGAVFAEDEIIVTTGGSEAIAFALTAVADAGDEVLVFEPLYPNYITFARMADIVLRPVTLQAKNNFHLPSRAEIEQRLSRKTKAIVVCNPSNPTGTVLDRRELQTIVDIARRHRLFIIADETYREIVFDQKRFTSLMSFSSVSQQVIVVDSVSKRFNLCGARIGCLASKNQEVMAAALKFAQGRLSSPTLEQLAVVPLLRNHRRYTRPLTREYQKRRDVVLAALRTIPGARCSTPEGAFYTMATLPVKDAEQFCRWLLEKFHHHRETVMLAPGSGFYATPGSGASEVRIAYVLNARKLSRAMAILRHAIIAYKKYHP